MRGVDELGTTTAGERWLSRLFGLAALAHLLGNPPDDFYPPVQGLAWAQAALALAAAWLVIRPGLVALGTVAAAVLVTAWLEAPGLPNHMWLLALASLALLAHGVTPAHRERAAPTLRATLVTFYGFAAFAKLNTGFLDPGSSCSAVLANHALTAAGLPTVGADSILRPLLIATVISVELAIPLALLFRRSRRAGVLLGLLFHSVLALDYGQHLYDFTVALFFFLSFFLPPDVRARFEDRSKDSRVLHVGAVLAAGQALGAALGVEAPGLFHRLPFLLFVPLAAWLCFHVLREPRQPPDPVPWRPGPRGGVVVLLALVSGLAPYLQLRTGTAFTMYSNLRVAPARSNHLIVGRALPLGPGPGPLVEIVASADEGLAYYVDSGWQIPARNLRHYLARVPGSRATVRVGGGLEGWGPDEARPMPLLQEKLGLFRSVDTHEPARCQAHWLPAH